ncbi:MAG: TRAP transporter permease [Synergistaceae bacterium]|jgi:TRAP transporter 4TM/12TM fusion protein|nr:TRAP transporter permease [Synergistaceae bacterium]
MKEDSSKAGGREENPSPEEQGERVLREASAENRYRTDMEPFWKYSVLTLSCIFVLYHIITSRFGMPLMFKHRAIHLGVILCLTWLYYPASKRSIQRRPSVLDMILIAASAAVSLYTVFNVDSFALRGGVALPRDYVFGAVAIVLVLEACRRVAGKGLLILAVVFLLYAWLGRYVPGVLSHRGYSIQRIIYQMYLTTEGIYGLPIGIASTYLVLFIVFSSMLEKSGLGTLFNDVALAWGGRHVGGPAKVAVIGSALVGMISGSAATNVATSGAFTIPLMKKVGYRAYFAGAVEAAASTGGQIMPPVMGTGAFIMAEFLGIPYIRIATVAIIPAVLYFAAVYFQVDIRARKIGLRGLPEDQIPKVGKTVRRYGHMFIPIVILVWLLMEQFTPLYAAFYSLLATWALSLFHRETRLGPSKLLPMAVNSARSCISLSVAMANAGFVVAVLSMTGIGIILADNIVLLSRGYLFVALILCMVVSIILGMGLPTSACYIIAASIAVPILREMKVPNLQAHMFVFYYSCLSTVTPPVALASYVAAGLSGSGTNEVGWAAFKLALAGFIVPFFFIYSPAILLEADSATTIVWAAATGLLGTALLSISVEGYLKRPLAIPLRILFFMAALALIHPGLMTDCVGFTLGALGAGYVFYTEGKNGGARTPA